MDAKLTVHPYFTPAGEDRTRHGSTLGKVLGEMKDRFRRHPCVFDLSNVEWRMPAAEEFHLETLAP